MTIDWKDRAYVRAKKHSQDIVTDGEPEGVALYYCTATEAELGWCVGDETFSFTSCGTCHSCGMDFHYSALKMEDSVSQPEWPIHYLGYYCKTCYYADDDDKDDIELDEPIEFEGEEEEETEEETEESEESANSNT